MRLVFKDRESAVATTNSISPADLQPFGGLCETAEEELFN